jgi:hypothetical protein
MAVLVGIDVDVDVGLGGGVGVSVCSTCEIVDVQADSTSVIMIPISHPIRIRNVFIYRLHYLSWVAQRKRIKD